MPKSSRGGVRGGGGGAVSGVQGAGTPSGVSYNMFMQMDKDERYDTMASILRDPNIKVPDSLDKSDTTKILYALGMDGKPTVVSDARLDSKNGTEVFMTVSDQRSGGKTTTSGDRINSIKTDKFVAMESDRNSRYSRGLQFEDSVSNSASSQTVTQNPEMIRAKIKPNAKIADYYTLANDSAYRRTGADYYDKVAVNALANGYDGWKTGSGTYVILNRSALNVSSTTKKLPGNVRQRPLAKDATWNNFQQK